MTRQIGKDKVFLSIALWWCLERTAPRGGMVPFSPMAINSTRLSVRRCKSIFIAFMKPALVQRHAIRSLICDIRPILRSAIFGQHAGIFGGRLGYGFPCSQMSTGCYLGRVSGQHFYCSQYRTPLETSLLHPFAPLYKTNPSCTSPVLQSSPGCPSWSYSELLQSTNCSGL